MQKEGLWHKVETGKSNRKGHECQLCVCLGRLRNSHFPTLNYLQNKLCLCKFEAQNSKQHSRFCHSEVDKRKKESEDLESSKLIIAGFFSHLLQISIKICHGRSPINKYGKSIQFLKVMSVLTEHSASLFFLMLLSAF